MQEKEPEKAVHLIGQYVYVSGMDPACTSVNLEKQAVNAKLRFVITQVEKRHGSM